MRNLPFIAAILLLSLSTCRSKIDVFPDTVWSAGCVELRPFQDVYRLQGICCAYVLMDPVDLKRSRQFTVPGRYFYFTGAGFDSAAISLQGEVVPGGKALYLRFNLPGQATPQIYQLEPGAAKLSCQCGCD